MSTWTPCPEPGRVGDSEAHLWLVELDFLQDRLGHLTSILSDDERNRAGRFHKRLDAERYASARASLRCILGGYLVLEPASLQFTYNRYGKPRLSEAHSSPLQFSVSHSAALCLFGFVLHREIGVDLEYVRPEVEVADLAARFFCRREVETLRSLAGQLQVEAFFRCWTRKEAYLKARGQGLSYGLDRIEVSLRSDEPAALISAADDPEASRRWTIEHLAPASGYVGAVAVADRHLTFKCFTWAPGTLPALGARP